MQAILKKLTKLINNNSPRRVIPDTRKLFWNDSTQRSIITRNATIIIAFLALTVNGLVYFTSPAFADGSASLTFTVNVPSDSLLEIKLFNADGTEMGSNTSMNVVPSMSAAGFNEKEVVVSVGTNNEWGYNLMMNVDNTSLVSSSDSSKTIPSLAERDAAYTCTPETADTCDFTLNSWGLKIKDTTASQPATNGYMAIPSSIELNKNTTTTNGDPTHILFGSKINAQQAPGAYSTTINFVATANPKPGPTLTFDANGGTFAGGSTKNVLTYSIPEIVPVTKTTSSRSAFFDENSRKASFTDNTPYGSDWDGYYDDITILGASSLNVKIYYAIGSNAGVCLLNPNAEADKSSNCDYQDAISERIYGYNNSGTTYNDTLVYEETVSGDTARIFFYNMSSGYYGYWAEVTGAGLTQNLISGTYNSSPTRSGYVFLGWSTNSQATTPNWTYNSAAIVAENTTIYAVWFNPNNLTTFDSAFASAGKSKQSGYYKMQDMNSSICNTVSTVPAYATSVDYTVSAQLIDTRDNKIYWVSKLADGNCWMTQNLDYDIKASGNTVATIGGGTTTWSPNTATSTSVFDNLSSTGTYSYDPGSSYLPNGTGFATTITCTSASNGGNNCHYHLGNYYQWNAATAGSGGSIINADATTSICPKGWRLPTSNSYDNNYSFGKLTSANGSSDAALLSSPLWFVRAGRVDYGDLNFQGSYGYVWSSRAGSNTNSAYHLYFSLFSVDPSRGYLRYYGLSVRCVAE